MWSVILTLSLSLGNILRARHTEDRYTGVLTHNFTILNYCLANECCRCTENIVTPKIVIPGFYPIHFTITSAGQTIVDHYTGVRSTSYILL